MSVTVVPIPYDGVKSGKIVVKPYFDPNMSNLGLEKYKMSLYDGVFHQEQLACIERNGVIRYLTGLNEFAPEVKLIEDKETREAKIKEIRSIVSQIERELNANVVDPTDEHFWNKIILLKPDNHDFWSKITLRAGNQDLILDPSKDVYDLIKLYAIENGGFSIVAPSYERARSMPVPPKFYLDKAVETIGAKTEVKKLRNSAISELDKIFKKNPTKLFYIAKAVDANSSQYKRSTPIDIIYDNMDKYINGESFEQNVARAAKAFLAATELDVETLKIKALIKDATFYRFISPRSDGFIYELESSAQMGRNASDCFTFLKNPLNDSVLASLLAKVENYWNQ